ncbi:MAG: EF-P lysine aminoacylase GenX [Gammaproteobacteria bacterium]|nr:EF-P lysine aminoacylase GenX [Gammaproteobacteria bacterium]
MAAVATRELLQRRADMLAQIRSFFAQRGVLEVDTPLLAHTTTLDPAIASLEVRSPLDRHFRGYLQTSPEFAMKRLLAGGAGDIYQLGHVFRDGESGRQHLREFTMLEFYRVGFDEHRLMDEVAELLSLLLPAHCAGAAMRISYREAFLTTGKVDPLIDAADDIAAMLRAHDVAIPQTMSRRELLDLALATVVMPALGHAGVCFLHDYPADQAALAALNAGTPPTAARFEVFVNGMELGNGYRELTDAVEQRRRFTAEREARLAAGLPTPPVDEALLAALAQGLPECAGIALGVDRMLMLAAGATNISDIVPMAFTDVA